MMEITEDEIKQYFGLRDKLAAVMDERGAYVSFLSCQHEHHPWYAVLGGEYYDQHAFDAIPPDDRSDHEDTYGFGEKHLILIYPKTNLKHPGGLHTSKTRTFTISMKHLVMPMEELVWEYQQKVSEPEHHTHIGLGEEIIDEAVQRARAMGFDVDAPAVQVQDEPDEE